MKWREVIDWVGRIQTIQSIANNIGFVVPVGTLAASIYAGYLYGHDWMEILFYSSGSCMFVLGIMILFIFYTERNNPENKLKFVGPLIKMDLVKGKVNAAKRIAKMQAGFQIRNDSFFPISFYIQTAETTLDDKQPPRSKFPKPAVTIGPSGIYHVSDEVIDMHERLCSDMSGYEHFVVRYGKRGNEKYTLIIKGELIINMKPSGEVTHTQLAVATNDDLYSKSL
jgi:hypothetical protein